MSTFFQGDRVITPKGPGVILYRRMNSLNLNEVQAYSVLLDSVKKAAEQPPFPNPSGNIFVAKDVSVEL